MEIEQLVSDLRKGFSDGMSKADSVRKVFRCHPGISRGNAIQVFIDGLDMSIKGASTYFHKYGEQARKPRKSKIGKTTSVMRNKRRAQDPGPTSGVFSNRGEFVGNNHIGRLASHISRLILGHESFEHEYKISHRQWKKAKGEQWHCDNLHEALKKYWWYGSFLENDEKLTKLSTELKKAIKDNNDSQAFLVAIKILDWGKVYRGAVEFLVHKYESKSLVRTLKNAIDSLDSDSFDLKNFDGDTLRMDSGLTKIYSLGSKRSIIFDDRVGTAITLITKRYFAPEEYIDLKKLKFTGRGENSARHKIMGDKFSHRITTHNHARYNLLANWLINESIQKAISQNEARVIELWGIKSSSQKELTRLRRKIEAALFMIGSRV